MAIEAEILEVSRPGDRVIVLVAYRENGKEVSRESIDFVARDTTADIIRERIVFVGQKIITSNETEILAKTLLGEKIVVDKVQNAPNPTPTADTINL